MGHLAALPPSLLLFRVLPLPKVTCPLTRHSQSELKTHTAAAPFAIPWTGLSSFATASGEGVGRVAWSFGTVTLACCKCELFSTGQLPICLFPSFSSPRQISVPVA